MYAKTFQDSHTDEYLSVRRNAFGLLGNRNASFTWFNIKQLGNVLCILFAAVHH